MFVVLGALGIGGIAKMQSQQRELQNARKYWNESSPPIPLHTSKSEDERAAAIYHNAGLLQQNAAGKEDFLHAANMYALIPDYQDAAARRDACRRSAEQ